MSKKKQIDDVCAEQAESAMEREIENMFETLRLLDDLRYDVETVIRWSRKLRRLTFVVTPECSNEEKDRVFLLRALLKESELMMTSEVACKTLLHYTERLRAKIAGHLDYGDDSDFPAELVAEWSWQASEMMRNLPTVCKMQRRNARRYRFVFLQYGGLQRALCDFGDFLKKFRDIFGSRATFVIIYGVAGVDRNGELREFFSDTTTICTCSCKTASQTL